MKKQELEPKTITKEDGELRILLSELHERLDYAFWQRRRIPPHLAKAGVKYSPLLVAAQTNTPKQRIQLIPIIPV